MTDFRILDPADGIPVPWPNGGGTSQEIVGHSEGDRLLWRMSTTHILASCPFSDYAGNARCITLLSEDGFDLDFGDTAPRLTARRFEPLPFDGGWPTTCHLHGRLAFVLNVMTLQGAARCETKLIALGPDEVTWRLPTAEGMIFCAAARCTSDRPHRARERSRPARRWRSRTVRTPISGCAPTALTPRPSSCPSTSSQRSSTSFAPRLPEQQIIMLRPAAFSSAVSTESRWSGVPSITRTSQLPQTPCSQA